MRTEALFIAGVSLILSCSDHRTDSKGSSTGGRTESGERGGAQNASGSSGSQVNTDRSGGPGAAGDGDATGASGNGANSTAGTSNTTGGKNGGSAGGTSSGSEGSGGKANSAGSSTKGGGAGADVLVNPGGKKDGGMANAGGGSTVEASPGAGGSSGDGGSAAVGCDRAGLDAAVQAYLAALKAGDASKMPLASSVKYTEIVSAKSTVTAIASGILTTALAVDYSRSLLDVTGCETFSEIFVPSGSHPYVLGTRLAVKDGKIAEIYTIDTDDGDWNFDAKAYQECSKSEDWSVLPEASRSTRDELIQDAQLYFDVFSDKSAKVPWGTPCYRLEGGKGCTPTIDNSKTGSCNVGIPDNITFKNTHWVVDVDLGAVVGITLFAGASPDTHMFRVVDKTIRKIHTLTVMD